MIKRILFILILFSGILSAESFKKSSLGIGVTVGGGSISTVQNGTQNYTILGVSADYFVMDDLAVGIGYRGWFGGTPTLNEFTIPLTYYIPVNQKVRPYIGAFVRETIVSDGYDNYESYGARVGVAISVVKNSYIGIGWITERQLSCAKWQDDCTSSYPEVVFALSF